MYYFNARWYDASTGRFISEDPARDGANWYVYTANNPIKYTDPSGLNLEKIISGLIKAGAGAIQTAAGTAGAVTGGAITAAMVADDATGVGVLNDAAIPAVAAATVASGAVAVNGAKKMGDGLAELAEGLAEAASGAMQDLSDLLNEAVKDGVDSNSKRHTPDQGALSGLAKEGKKTGVTNKDADTLLGWDDELGMGGHDDRGTDHWLDGQDHIPVKEDEEEPESEDEEPKV